MAQYCRYCSHMICGDFNYCNKKYTVFSDKQLCTPNKCRDFDLNPIDALGLNQNGYKPREEQPSEEYEQLKMEV